MGFAEMQREGIPRSAVEKDDIQVLTPQICPRLPKERSQPARLDGEGRIAVSSDAAFVADGTGL
eukprot:1804942-Rhodomonas_salina.1